MRICQVKNTKFEKELCGSGGGGARRRRTQGGRSCSNTAASGPRVPLRAAQALVNATGLCGGGAGAFDPDETLERYRQAKFVFSPRGGGSPTTDLKARTPARYPWWISTPAPNTRNAGTIFILRELSQALRSGHGSAKVTRGSASRRIGRRAARRGGASGVTPRRFGASRPRSGDAWPFARSAKAGRTGCTRCADTNGGVPGRGFR